MSAQAYALSVIEAVDAVRASVNLHRETNDGPASFED